MADQVTIPTSDDDRTLTFTWPAVLQPAGEPDLDDASNDLPEEPAFDAISAELAGGLASENVSEDPAVVEFEGEPLDVDDGVSEAPAVAESEDEPIDGEADVLVEPAVAGFAGETVAAEAAELEENPSADLEEEPSAAETEEPSADAGTEEPSADAGTEEEPSAADTEEPSADAGTKEPSTSVIPAADPHVPEPPKLDSGESRLTRIRQSFSLTDALRAALTVIGTLLLLCSLTLAIGALTVAIGVDLDGGVAGRLATVCNTLSGPLHSALSFSGDNAEQKRDLVVWGVGSLGYLILGSFIQSIARRRSTR